MEVDADHGVPSGWEGGRWAIPDVWNWRFRLSNRAPEWLYLKPLGLYGQDMHGVLRSRGGFGNEITVAAGQKDGLASLSRQLRSSILLAFNVNVLFCGIHRILCTLCRAGGYSR